MNTYLFERDDERMAGAEFSPCRKYRYALWRRWADGNGKLVMFIGLNPSTADELKNDPTIRRCIRFAKEWGYSGILMMNAYSFRATDPKVMKAEAEPVGAGNDQAFRERHPEAGLIIAAWGGHCEKARALELQHVLTGREIHCLGINANGSPKHPLYLRADEKPRKFDFENLS